jgi:hypothetical protein
MMKHKFVGVRNIMAGSMKIRAIWFRTKREIFEDRMGLWDSTLDHEIKRTTKMQRKIAKNKRQGVYWKYRNMKIARRFWASLR